jgi:hypothetical protein
MTVNIVTDKTSIARQRLVKTIAEQRSVNNAYKQEY